MSERRTSRWLVAAIAALGVTAWAVWGRRHTPDPALSAPERAVERGKDAAGVVAETTAELLHPPGTDRPTG